MHLEKIFPKGEWQLNNNHKKTDIDFSDITPKMQIKKIRYSKKYERAFLKSDVKTENNFNRNTSSDD